MKKCTKTQRKREKGRERGGGYIPRAKKKNGTQKKKKKLKGGKKHLQERGV